MHHNPFTLNTTSQDDQNLTPLSQTPTNITKIKPLIHRSCQKIEIDQDNLRKYIKHHPKNSFPVLNQVSSSLLGSKGLIKTLIAQNSLSKLYYNFQNHSFLNNLSFCTSLKTLSPSLSSLTLQYIDESALRALRKSLAYLKNLQHLEIGFNFNYQMTTKSFRKLLQSLLYLKKLTHISFNFPQCVNFQGTDLVILSSYLKMLTNLQTLRLNFEGSIQIDDKSLVFLASILPSLKSLSQFDLNLAGGRRIEGKTILELFKSFQAMQSLSDLTLNLKNCNIVNQNNSESLADGLLSLASPSIKRLNLHIYQHSMNIQSLSRISQALKRFTSLETLQLNLNSCSNVTSQGTADLGLALSNLTSLNSLTLLVASSIASEFLVRDIASALKSLPNLVNLDLDFARKEKTTNVQVQQLFVNLKTLTRLQFLNLNLSFQNSLSDHALEILGNSLKEQPLLQSLSLNFYCTGMITNQGVDTLCSSIKNLQKLYHLALNFGYNQDIDEKAIEQIAQTLESLPSLNNVSLTLMNCPQLTTSENSFTKLFQVLKETKNIHEIFLHMNRSEMNLQRINDLKRSKIVQYFLV